MTGDATLGFSAACIPVLRVAPRSAAWPPTWLQPTPPTPVGPRESGEDARLGREALWDVLKDQRWGPALGPAAADDEPLDDPTAGWLREYNALTGRPNPPELEESR